MIEINDDETASRILTEAKQVTGDEREQMADALIAYGEKKAAQEYNDTDDRFSKLFTDQAYFEQEKQANTAVQEAPDPDQAAKRTLIGAWLEHRNGRPIDTMSYQAERDAFAMANYGQKNLDDNQLFDFISGEYNTQKKKTEAINDLQMQAVSKAITDSQLGQNRPFVDGMTEVFNQWQGKYPELVDGKNDAAFLSQGYKLYYDTINDLDTVRPQASKALSTLTSFTQGNATDKDMQSLANDFVSAPPEDRQKIYKYVTLAAQAGQIDRAGLEQFAINMGQSFTRGFDFIPQGSLQIQEAGVNDVLQKVKSGQKVLVPQNGDITKATVAEQTPKAQVLGQAPTVGMFATPQDGYREATPEEADQFATYAKNAMESFKVVRELRNVAKTGVDPIRPVLEEDSFWGTAERGAYGLAGSIPLMGATAVNPYLGVLAYQATEYDRIMLENPDIDPQFAQGLALVEGVANAAIDRVQLSSLSGKLPMFGRYLDRIASDGVRRTVKIGANVVEQNLQEGAQDLIAPVLETAVASLREDMPDKDFTSLMDEWAGQRAETFFATLPLALIGGGIATYRDLKNPSAELNATRLRQVGFDKEQTTFIQRAENPEEYTARIQMEWDKRTPEAIEAGRQEVIAEMQQAATPGENDARISETVAEDGTRRWVVTAPDGKELLQTQDQQAALEAVRQHSEAQMINERNTVADMVDYFRAQDPTNTATIEAPRTVQQELDRLTEAGDSKGIANLNERIRFAGIPEGADLTTYNILGEANVETTAEGVFRGVIKLRENSRPEDAFEEINHVFVRKAIAEDRVDLDSLRGWLTQTSEATGETYATETETEIIENIAKVGMDYAAGRIDETSLPASFVDYIKRMLQVFKEAMARAIKLKDAFATGKIDSNFESFLADSVGLNQQARVDTASSRVSKDIITDGGQMLMDFSIGSRTSAVSTDTPSIRASNATITGPANYSIGAFHGTPHKVDKFSTEKIGTGEGAQAYGWGLYFAENKRVAEDYRDNLSGPPHFTENMVTPSGIMPWQDALRSFHPDKKVAETTIKVFDKMSVMQGKKPVLDTLQDEVIPEMRTALNLPQDRWSDFYMEQASKGNLYTAELDAEPEDLLDWDKPLSEQSPKVQAALNAVQSDHWLWKEAMAGKGGEQVGAALYKTLTATWPDSEFARDGIDPKKKASEALLAAGIPGIRYLDGGSRSEGQGTYNYVAFDESLIRITEENGNRIAAADALTSGQTNYSIGSMPEDQRAAEQSGQPSRGGLNAEESFGRPSEEFVESDVKKTYWNINSEGGSLSLYKETPWDEDSDSATGESKYSVFYSENLESDNQDEYKFSNPADAKEKIDSILREETQAAEYGKWVESTIDSFRGTFDFKKSKFFTSAEVKPIGWSSKSSSRYFSVNLDIKPEIAETFDSKNIGDYEDGTLNLRVRFADHAEKSGPSNDISIETRDYHSQQFSRQDSKTAESQMASAIADGVLWKKIAEIYNDPDLDFNRPAPAPGATNYSIGKKKSAGGIRFDEIAKEDPKHDGSRVGTAWQGKVKPTTQDTNDGIASVVPEELEKQMAMLTHFVDGVPLPKFITKHTNPKKRMRAFIEFQKGNLLALYDAFDSLSADYVIRSTHWYDGARLLAEGIRDLYGLTIEQSSAIIAVFSPMKDWFQNVAMGQRFADVMANHQKTKITKEKMSGAIEEMLNAAENQKFVRNAFALINGKSIEQLLKNKTKEGRTLAAVAVRLMSTHVHGLSHDVLSPEGESLGIRKNKTGSNKKMVWQSYPFIEKAISVYENGKLENISKALGTEHKIRNFYNNIVAPTSPYGDATVDTHAVNAAVLYPMGGSAYLTTLNFGDAGVAGGGNSGLYWIFHEALREASAERGVMPRQMQSITWEAIRGLFTDVRKRDKKFVAAITKIWENTKDAEAARSEIIGLGITPPEWARVAGSDSQRQAGSREADGQPNDSAGSVRRDIRQGRQGGNRGAGVSNYSIASQSEIDRVNRALGGMNRGPDERLKVYQRAKQKFSKLMAWNSDELAAMADTGSDDSQIRRTQILQALGELDGILSVLPPEVRGRVGGYTKLAGIAPMDVLKDGVKVSEVSGMNGAIISAWMREGQNIGQAGKQVSLPPGYEATENLSTKRADKAIADFFRDRIKRIDTELEKVLVREYTEAITKAVKQSRPKAGDNGVRKSTLGAETQKFADMVQRATLLDDEATPKRMAEIEAALTNPDATAEDVSALSEEWSILNTFGDLDNRSSETLAQGLDWLKGQLQMGREAWRIKEQARIDEQRARARQTIEWLGKGTAKKRNATKTKSELASDLANHYLLSHANFEQFVTAIFPPEIASRWAEKLRKADEASQTAEIRDRKGILDAVRAGAKAANMSTADALLWLKADQKNAVAYLEDRKVTDERIAIDLAQKIVTGEADRSKLTDADVETLRNELAALPADTQKEYVTIKRVIFRGNDVKLDMSRGKAMQYLLSWNQPDVQIKMRKEGWTDESAADLQALVNDPVSREVMAYAKELYGKGAGIVNPVYSRMFGMNMPQVKNYAPTRFLNAKDSKDIGLDGSATATGTTPSFAKSRVTHSAKIAPEDALTVMQGHIAQQAHWVHFAELAREFRAILSNPEVRESIKQTQGESVLKDAELWADQMEQRGGNKASESTWMNTILGTVLSGKAISSLGFNLKTLAMQLENTIRFGLALDMKQIVSALSNPAAIVEDIQTVWESNAIQNRLQGGATAEARFLFSRYAGKPNFAAKIAEASMTPINWLDSAGTSISSAIVYRANLNDALAAGMPENLAKQAALNAASEAIYRFAQPVSFGQKSIMENNGNVLAKTFFLFMSDPRLKTAILADAARGLATGRGNASEHIRRIVTVELMAVLSHVISSAFRDAFSDDDDEEIWNLGGFAKAILLAPLQGFFFAGTVGELAISKLTGQKFFSSTQNPLVTSMEQAIRAGTNMEDAINFDDPDAMLKEWNNIFRSMAVTPTMAAPAVLLNMVKPVVGLYQNATTDE